MPLGFVVILVEQAASGKIFLEVPDLAFAGAVMVAGKWKQL
jgi:hypothetical protein